MRYTEKGQNGHYSVECENTIVTFNKGKLFGEIALLEPSKATRLLSALTKTDCILLVLNQEAFDIIIKEKLKKNRE